MKNAGHSEQFSGEGRSRGGFRVDGGQDGVGSESDEQLLSGFLSGDEAAFARLVGRHSQSLFQFVARFVRDLALAEDVVQETFLQVHQSAGGFDPSRRFRPWLFTIAANKARDQLRGRARKREISLGANPGPEDGEQQVSFASLLAAAPESPSEPLEASEQREIVRRIVSNMPEHLREVLVLGYYQRFAYKEIAEVLSIPLGTVKSRLHAAVAYFAEAYRRETEK